jgi:DNA-binding response OmpR family regulator
MKEFPPFHLDTGNPVAPRRRWRRRRAHPSEAKGVRRPALFVEHAGRLVTQEELLDAVWPDTYVQPAPPIQVCRAVTSG